MALVKKSTIGSRAKKAPSEDAAVAVTSKPQAAPPTRRRTKAPTSAVERMDQATQELASGLMEASAASAQLEKAVDQIASGAEEAAGAAQESLGLIGSLGANFREARERADDARRQSDVVQISFTEIATQIDSSVSAIELNAQRQVATIDLIASLETSDRQFNGAKPITQDRSEGINRDGEAGEGICQRNIEARKERGPHLGRCDRRC